MNSHAMAGRTAAPVFLYYDRVDTQQESCLMALMPANTPHLLDTVRGQWIADGAVLAPRASGARATHGGGARRN